MGRASEHPPTEDRRRVQLVRVFLPARASRVPTARPRSAVHLKGNLEPRPCVIKPPFAAHCLLGELVFKFRFGDADLLAEREEDGGPVHGVSAGD